MTKLKLAGLSGALFLVSIVFGQACAPMEAVQLESSEIASLGAVDAVEVLKLDPNSVLSKENPIRVNANVSQYPSGTKLLWDHVFGNGLTFCEQTTEFDRSTTVFVCPENATLKVFLIALLPSGEEKTSTIEIVLNAAGAAADPSATPIPALNGTQLYNMHCSGCHGPLASSAKRGISISALNNAITSVGTMRGLSSLSSAERQAIVQALQ